MSRQVIFVFGSNVQGRHSAGAAAFAAAFHGAKDGVAEGLQGTSYAIPTCSWDGKRLFPLAVPHIQLHAQTFKRFAREHEQYDFLLTAIGCGIAGYQPSQMADLFLACPDNVYIQARLAYGL